VFSLAIIWAFVRGVARGAVELQVFAALCTFAIPLVSLTSVVLPGFGWNHSGGAVGVDILAILGACSLAYAAYRTQERIRRAPSDSIWHRRAQQSFPA
ncbi:MAG: hypothetical protein V7766_04040, partial [Hyphomonas oceanitis]